MVTAAGVVPGRPRIRLQPKSGYDIINVVQADSILVCSLENFCRAQSLFSEVEYGFHERIAFSIVGKSRTVMLVNGLDEQ
jgi:hypothetical protein